MNVRVRVLRAVYLDNPVDSGEIYTTCGDVRTEKHGVFLLDELEVDGRALVLILLPVQLEQVLADLERFK